MEPGNFAIQTVNPCPQATSVFRLGESVTYGELENRVSGQVWYIEPIGALPPRTTKRKVNMLRKKILLVILLSLMAGTLRAQEAKVTSLMSKDLPENPGKEMLMITVEHAPGGSSAIHRHNAHAFVYVLEGSVVMQVKGGKEVTLTPGQT